MWDSSHTHTHHTINQIGVSQSPPLKSLTSSLGSTLWGSVSEPTRDYRTGSDTICNDPRKSTSHICAIPQKDQSQLRLLVVVNKTQIYPVNTRCGTHHTPTHITQSIKLGYHQNNSKMLDFLETPDVNRWLIISNCSCRLDKYYITNLDYYSFKNTVNYFLSSKVIKLEDFKK